MAKNKNVSFLDRMKAGRKQKGGMKSYIFVFILASIAVIMSYFVGFIEITDGVHILNVTGNNVILGTSGPSCIVGSQTTCVAPLPLTITLVANQLYAVVYISALVTIFLSFLIKKNRVFTYISAFLYLAIAVLIALAPSILQFTDGVNNIRHVVKPTLNNGGTTIVVLAALAAFTNLIVYRATGND